MNKSKSEKIKEVRTIQYLGKQLYFWCEYEDIDGAQFFLDIEKEDGRVACALHENGKHQMFVEKARWF